jgi:outer membrane protein assembly factor BamA
VPYLRLTRPLEVGFHPGKASVYVYPEKSGSNRFDGWVGLSPDLRTAGKLAFSGALLLNLDNVLGQGENWLFDWQRNQDASQKLNLGVHFQYLAGLPFGLKGKFGLYRQDTSYLNMEWDLGIPYHFSPDHLINVFVRKRESSLLAPEADLKNSTRRPFESFLSGLAWEYSRLDNRINPHHGFVFKAEVVTGRKSMPDSIPMQQTELIADASWFLPLARSITCGLLLQSGYRKTPVTFDNEQYRIGGFNLLRGFDEDVFHTNAFAVGSIELRYLLDRSSHLIVLTDLGVLSTIENDEELIKIPLGMGLGGQIRTAGGIFRIIFALGKAGGQPFNFKNSKIHLGYVGVF